MRAADRVRRGCRSRPDAHRSCSGPPARAYSGARLHDRPDGPGFARRPRGEANHDLRSRDPAVPEQRRAADVEPLGLGALHDVLGQALHGFSPRAGTPPTNTAPSSPEQPARPAAGCPNSMPSTGPPARAPGVCAAAPAEPPDGPFVRPNISTQSQHLRHFLRVDVLANGSSPLRPCGRWSSSSLRG